MGGCLTHESRTVILILYDGKFSEGENFHEFQGFVAIGESFLRKILECSVLWWHQRVIRGSFLHKILFSINSQKFSPLKVSTIRYTRPSPREGYIVYCLGDTTVKEKCLVCCLGNKSKSPGLDGQMNIQSDRVTC